MDHAGPFDIRLPGVPKPWERKEKASQRSKKATKPRYCLIIVDKTTRFPLLIPVADVTTATTIEALEKEVYPKYGPPKTIILDAASSFTGSELDQHCRKYNILTDIISPENHRSNGLAELYVRFLHNHFSKMDHKLLDKWYTYIPQIQYSLCNTPLSDNHLTPIEMLRGKKVNNPLLVFDPQD
jgi:transposase InsO family protein